MKLIKFCLLSLFALSLYSCPLSFSHYHDYEKAFFLGEEQFLIDGTVYDNYRHGTEHETPKEFNKITVRADVDGWEINGVKKANGNFECLITTTANGVTISKETIKDQNLNICKLWFYLDDDSFPMSSAYGKEKRKGEDGYSVFYYYYVYVAEAMDLSRTYDVEHEGPPWDYTTTHHVDLNFSKPGWYKIVMYDNYPIKDAPKHSSGKNTSLQN